MNFGEFNEYLAKNSSFFDNHKLVKVIQEYSFILISEKDDYFEKKQYINQNIKNSKVIIIDSNYSLF